MQKVYNLLGVLGFTISTILAVIGLVSFIRVPSMIKLYLSEMQLELTDTILKQVPAPEIPELPKATGPAIPFK